MVTRRGISRGNLGGRSEHGTHPSGPPTPRPTPLFTRIAISSGPQSMGPGGCVIAELGGEELRIHGRPLRGEWSPT
jgi:hypothetical protein